MATKIQFKYGQFTHEIGCQMSIDTPGLVVFNGACQEIYVDGQTFGFSDAGLQELLRRVSTLEDFREAMRVTEYAQAEITVDIENETSELLIANIGQGKGDAGENDGKIYKGENFVVKIDGAYSDNGVINPLATVRTVQKVKEEILGTIDPEELEKTLDTIKEIQDVLLNGAYTIEHVTERDPETGDPTKVETIHTEKVITKDPETGEITSIEYTNGEEEPDKVVYATEDLTKPEDDPERIQYTEDYQNLKQTAPIENLVAKVEVKENKDNQFVEATREDADVTIGVKYGTFKTGHGNVMDETSTAFVDGIATVADVQKYIEERLTWVSYEVSSQSVAENINKQGDNVTIGNNSNVPDSLIITNNN
jgi:hypothetical protein